MMVHVTLTAQKMAVDPDTVAVPAGLTFVNRDDGVPHVFALHTGSSAAKKLYSGQVVTGPKTVTYAFTPLLRRTVSSSGATHIRR